MTTDLKEYIVTLKNYNDLDQFYLDIETEGTTKEFVPSRSVECVSKRPVSRNTHYLLTDDEARLLRKDPRVEAVTLITGKIFKTNNYATQTAIWDRGSDLSLGQKNWGLYRTQLAENPAGWGSGSGADAITAPINFTASGKNVDVIVVDEVLYPDHPEFTGRVVTYDWFRQHDLTVRGSATTITNVSRSTNVATVTTSAPHRLVVNTIVDIVCTSDSSFNATAARITEIVSSTQFSYANTGSNVSTTSATGFWRGVYQYPSYSGSNNHATAVAGVIAGSTQGWARSANIYNLRHDATGLRAGEYTPPDLLIDYIREFHRTKAVNPVTGRKNPTLVNNSWGFVNNLAFSSNIYTSNPNYSRLFYRGNYVTAGSSAVDTGITGVCTQSNLLDTFDTMEGTAYRITTSGTPSATITPITFTENGTSGLTSIGSPTASGSNGIDTNDDAIWQITLPFTVQYAGTSYTSLTLCSNSFIAFGTPFLLPNSLVEFDYNYPAVNKIFISAGDRNVQNIRRGTFGTTPNRTHVIRFEGWDGAYGSTNVEEPSNNLIWEVVLYEATPNRIDVRIVKNAAFRPEFTISEINSYGAIVDGPPTPVRVASMDADIADAISEGIIFVGAAGNSGYKIDVTSGNDYDNYIVENGETIHYHRGSTPSNSHPSLISVGSLDSSSFEPKAATSNTGPGVDLYAPGENIVSSVFDKTGNLSTVVTDKHLTIDGGFAGTGSILAQAGKAAIITVEEHGLSNGDIVTIDDCSNSNYNVDKAVITVIDANSFSFNISNGSYSSGLETLTGTVKAGALFQKWSGTSIAAAQVTGLLALALEAYPSLTQAEAKAYLLNFAKTGLMSNTGSTSYTDAGSLQGGANRIAFLHKERLDTGALIPKTTQRLRPTSGQLYPRPVIRKK